MRKTELKVLGYVVSAVLAVSLAPFSAFAENGDDEAGVDDSLRTLGASDFIDVQDASWTPSGVDLRNYNGKNYVTPVKSQKPWDACWSFGVVAAAETSILFAADLGVPAGQRNGNVDLSEFYAYWYSLNALTSEDVAEGIVPASQVGEGIDVSGMHQADVFAMGGGPESGISAFSQHVGPTLDSFSIVAGENPFAYKGVNGWRENDRDESAAARVAREEWYRYVWTRDGQSDYLADFEASIDALTYNNACYAPFDTWRLANSALYRNNRNAIYNARFVQAKQLACPADFSNGGYSFDNGAASAMKAELASGHAIAASMYSDLPKVGEDGKAAAEFTNLETFAQFTNEQRIPDHVVCIVGYDDNYPADRFAVEPGGVGTRDMPPGDGAWIIKDSWGAETNGFPNQADWGADGSGYLYVSYYDQSLGASGQLYTFEFSPDAHAREQIIGQYDLFPTNDISTVNYDAEAKMANVFTASDDQDLFAIGVRVENAPATVEYEVRRVDNRSDPDSGVLLETGRAAFDNAGYRQIQLTSQHRILKGESYSVIVKITQDNGGKLTYQVLQPMATTLLGGKGSHVKTVVNANESFRYANGAWSDLGNLKQGIESALFATLDSAEDASLYPDGRESVQVDNYPIKAFSYPASSDSEGNREAAVEDPGTSSAQQAGGANAARAKTASSSSSPKSTSARTGDGVSALIPCVLLVLAAASITVMVFVRYRRHY